MYVNFEPTSPATSHGNVAGARQQRSPREPRRCLEKVSQNRLEPKQATQGTTKMSHLALNNENLKHFDLTSLQLDGPPTFHMLWFCESPYPVRTFK